MIYVGIDPGKNGGIVAIKDGRVKLAVKMPDTLAGIWNTISDARGFLEDCRVFIEEVHAMPGQGVTSMFNFGYHYGGLVMALTLTDVMSRGSSSTFTFAQVQPQVWQRVMNCRTKGNKDVTKRLAQKLFPKLTVTHAIADALLIAEYNRRQGR